MSRELMKEDLQSLRNEECMEGLDGIAALLRFMVGRPE